MFGAISGFENVQSLRRRHFWHVILMKYSSKKILTEYFQVFILYTTFFFMKVQMYNIKNNKQSF